MNPPKVHIVDMEGLAELLDEIMNEETTCSTEEARKRFKSACSLAYGVTRNGLDEDKPLIADLLGHAHHNTVTSSGVTAAAACLIMQASVNYMEMEQKKDPAKFKKKFILHLDNAVQSAGFAIEETNEARTKQSAKKRSSEPS